MCDLANHPLISSNSAPLSIAQHTPTVDHHPTDGWMSLVLRTKKGAEEFYIEPAISRGTRWGPWGTYKEYIPALSLFAFDWGAGPLALNLLDAWIEGRNLAGKDPDPTGWELFRIHLANEQFATAVEQTLISDYINIYPAPLQTYGIPGPKRHFAFIGTVAGIASPSISALFEHCHPGALATTALFPVSHDNDDCRLIAGAYQACPSRCPPVLQAGRWMSPAHMSGSHLRFINVDIPFFAEITSASLFFTSQHTLGTTLVKLRISAEQEDNPPDFSADNWTAAWVRYLNHTAKVNWDNLPPWVLNTIYQSPNIKSVIQAIMNRTGRSSGDAIVLFWEDYDHRTPWSPSKYRRAYPHNIDSSKAVILAITYNH